MTKEQAHKQNKWFGSAIIFLETDKKCPVKFDFFAIDIVAAPRCIN